MFLISAEQIARVDFFFYIIQNRIISISNDASTHFFELLEIVYDLTSKESAAVLKCRFINDNSGSFGLDPFHNTLDAALPEVVAVTLHCKKSIWI